MAQERIISSHENYVTCHVNYYWFLHYYRYLVRALKQREVFFKIWNWICKITMNIINSNDKML